MASKNPNIDAFFDLAHHDVLALVKKKLDELSLEEKDLKTAQTNAKESNQNFVTFKQLEFDNQQRE